MLLDGFTTCCYSFLNLRLKKDAQLEIRLYAEAVREILEKQIGMDFVLRVCLDEL